MIVYKIKNVVNGKIYIGQTIRELSDRIKSHFRQSKNSNTLFSRAIRKYGINSFLWEQLCICSTKKNLSESETFYINLYKSNHRGYGYNLTSGGEGMGGLSPSEETRKKLRIVNIGKKHTDETKKKMSISQKIRHQKYVHPLLGKSHPKRGKPITDDIKEKIRKSLTGRKLTTEHKAKISRSQIGRKHTEESKLKMRKPKRKNELS